MIIKNNERKTFFQDVLRDNIHVVNDHYKRDVILTLISCKTTMGNVVYVCNECNETVLVPIACQHRACPTCNTKKREKWKDDRLKEQLPTDYLHIVFTTSHDMNYLFTTHERGMTNVLFRAVAETVKEVFVEKYGLNPGFISVMHTWDTQLQAHYHVHVIVPTAGFNVETNEFEELVTNYFINNKSLGKKFKVMFFKQLRKCIKSKEYDLDKLPQKTIDDLDNVYKKSANWVAHVNVHNNSVNCLDYISRYVNRVALSVDRIVNYNKEENVVTLRIRGKKGEKAKHIHLSGEEFVKRFSRHIPAKRATRVRYYGYFAGRGKSTKLPIAQQWGKTKIDNDPKLKASIQNSLEALKLRNNNLLQATERACPLCKTGTLEYQYSLDFKGDVVMWPMFRYRYDNKAIFKALALGMSITSIAAMGNTS